MGSRDGGLLGFLRAVRTQSPGGRREHHPVTHCHCDGTVVRMSSTVETATEIRPFDVDVPDEALEDLRRRIAATQWPEKETVADQSQGVQLATMRKLARYWETEYDWRACEARLNALPQFTTEIDGLDIHFIHVRSQHEDALPLVVNHGWPGSIVEQLKIIEPLTDPTAHGASAADAFHVVIPSMPGYGFSGKPTSTGWGPERMGRAWAELMDAPRLHPLRRPGRRLGCVRRRPDGPAGARGLARHPQQHARHRPGRRRRGSPGRRAAAGGSLGGGTTRVRAAGADVQAGRVRQVHGGSPADPVRHRGLTGRPGRLASRPQRRRRAAGRGGRRRSGSGHEHHRRADARRDPRQHHALLAHEHRGLRVPPLLGVQGRLLQREGRLHPRGRDRLPRRAVPGAAELGRAGVPQSHLLQRGRQRRPLRSVGGAGALLRRGASRVQVTANERRHS